MRHIVAAIIFLLSTGTVRASENLSQLITDARVLARDPSSNSRQRFTDVQVTEFINQGQREALSSNHCLAQNITFQLVPGSTYYNLPQNFLNITRVTIGTKWIQEMSPAALDGRSRGWEAASGYPTYYFVNFSSRSLIGFAPWPAAATDTDTVKVEFDIQANDLVNSTDIPFNGVLELQDYHHALAYFAAGMMAAVDEHPSQSTAYLGIFVNEVKMMNSHCVERSNYFPSATGAQ